MFKNKSYTELGASPANAHPGSAVTLVYASEVYKYLIANNYIPIQQNK